MGVSFMAKPGHDLEILMQIAFFNRNEEFFIILWAVILNLQL